MEPKPGPYGPGPTMGQPPMYNMTTPGVQVAPVQAAVVVQSPVRWSWCPLITTLFAVVCCPLCGIPGMAAALLSYTDHKAKEYDRAAKKRSVALGCGITGVVLGVLWIIIVIAVQVAAIAALTNSSSNYYNK